MSHTSTQQYMTEKLVGKQVNDARQMLKGHYIINDQPENKAYLSHPNFQRVNVETNDGVITRVLHIG